MPYPGCTKGVLIVTFRYPGGISELKNPDIELLTKSSVTTDSW